MTNFFENETDRTTVPEEDLPTHGQAVRDHRKEDYGSLEETYENLRETLDSIFDERSPTENYSLPKTTEGGGSKDTTALLALPQGKNEDKAVEDFGVRVVKYPKEGTGKTKRNISKKKDKVDGGSSEAGGDVDTLDGWDI